jgi:electron transfer flavoprotein beta subunit
VTILPDINTPRIPTLKQVLGAAKKPVENITLDALGQTCAPCLQALDTLGAAMDRRRLKFGPEPEGIRSVVGALLKEGVIA